MKILKGLKAGVKLVEVDDGSRRKLSTQEYIEYLRGEKVDDTLEKTFEEDVEEDEDGEDSSTHVSGSLDEVDTGLGYN